MRYEVDPVSGCWNWTGYVSVYGYGITKVLGKQAPAHRVAYMLLVGPVPGDLHVHHLCGNKRCINPEHLEAIAIRDHHVLHNPRAKTCIWGHPFDEANTYVRKNGEHQCRKCKARRERERRSRLAHSDKNG